jgi:pyruvate dehydrogenase E1 component alpha subunit
MLLTRTFDGRAVALQRTGRLGTYASPLGQEAIGAAVGHAMAAEDVLFPSYREYAAMLLRGVTLTELLLYWGGDERGSDYRAAGAREDFPICVPIGSHAGHAVGAARAFQLRGQKRAALYVGGDGSTSKGDFHEALNLAGVWRLPAIFVINNNQWAISVPRRMQTASETIAQKAVAYGIEGLQVDGNDLLALHQVMERSLAKARDGGGPTLIEALTYRLSDHTTADDSARYRSHDEVKAAWEDDPVARLREFMHRRGYWDAERERLLIEECKSEAEAAVQAYLDTPPLPAVSMFDSLYAELPRVLESQRREVEEAERG